jgi:superoxide dismutase, Cu-Zn family
MSAKSFILAGLLLACTFPPARADSPMRVPIVSVDASGSLGEIGVVLLQDTPFGLLIRPALQGLAPGLHGFHVHEHPSCAPTEKDGQRVAAGAAGPHLDPHHAKHHGSPTGQGHLGDLPQLFVDALGRADQPVLAPRLKLRDVLNRSLIIHAGPDNHADHPLPLGGGGARVACGVIDARQQDASWAVQTLRG